MFSDAGPDGAEKRDQFAPVTWRSFDWQRAWCRVRPEDVSVALFEPPDDGR